MSKQENSKAVNPYANYYLAATPLTAPFTDEEGYKVIGAFQYGRGFPYSFERAMFVIDDAAGYERESYTMGALHRQQRRNRVAATKNAAIAADSAAQASAAQAEEQTAGAAGSTPTGASSKYSNLPKELRKYRKLPQTTPAPTTTSPTTPEAVVPTAAPEPGSGANISTWEYEGAVLAYLDDTNIDQGKDDVSTPESVTDAETTKEVPNTTIADKGTPNPDTLEGITAESGFSTTNWLNNISGNGLTRSVYNLYNPQVTNGAYIPPYNTNVPIALGLSMQNGLKPGQQGVQNLPDESPYPKFTPAPAGTTNVVMPRDGKVSPSTESSGKGVFVFPKTVPTL
jgi:hypothetical protein